MNLSIAIAGLAGGLLGIRHAFEPDHLAAMTTLSAAPSSTAGRPRFRQYSLLLGAMWGVGHTLGLLLVVAALSLMNVAMTQRTSQALEMVVGVMLIGLGVRAIIKSYTRKVLATPPAAHRHGGDVHHHAAGVHSHIGQRTILWRPLAIGAVHGLAGSGAMLVLVAASIDSVAGRCLYVLMFGIGSTLGMSAMTLVSAIGFARLLPTHQAWISRASGALSIAIGVWWAAIAALS